MVYGQRGRKLKVVRHVVMHVYCEQIRFKYRTSAGSFMNLLKIIKGYIVGVERKQPVGQQFYVNSAEKEFTARVGSWLEYLQVLDLFPNLNSLPDKIVEVGEKLRSAGDGSFFGLADKKNNAVLIRPGDYATLLHELTHNNPQFNETLLSSEGGAFALQLFTTGCFDDISMLLDSFSYRKHEKRIGRILSEASLTLGRFVFDYLKKHKLNSSETNVLIELDGIITQYEGKFMQTSSPVDYLVECHKITPFVAEYLLSMTTDTKDTIVRSTSQTKKDVIGAFKALASFYHINLGYSLQEAISKTEKHFEKNEALTIHKTLTRGAKDVYAKLKEYGYAIDICRRISEIMITNGPDNARKYASNIPSFIELTGKYGPQGTQILGFALQHPAFFAAISEESTELLRLSEIQPEHAALMLNELMKYPWTHALDNKERSLLYSVRLLDNHAPEEKAAISALTFYMQSIDPETAKEILGSSTKHWTLFDFERLLSQGSILEQVAKMKAKALECKQKAELG